MQSRPPGCGRWATVADGPAYDAWGSGCGPQCMTCTPETRWRTACLAARRATCGTAGRSPLDAVTRDAGLEQDGGHIRVAGARDDLGRAEAAVGELEARLRTEPFHAPEADELLALSSASANWPRPSGPAGCCDCATGWCCCPPHPRWRCGAGAAGTTVHHERGAPGPGHHAAGRDPAAGTPRLARLDPPAGRRPPRDRAAKILKAVTRVTS